MSIEEWEEKKQEKEEIEKISKNDAQRAQIRSIAEIKFYLEHFLPQLSITNSISIFIIKPISILFNISFIVLQFYYYNAAHYEFSSESEYHIWIIKKVTVWIELIVLMMLILCAIYVLMRKQYSSFIFFVELCGSWSLFLLFYKFRPIALLEYYSTVYNHHPLKLKQRQQQKSKELKQVRESFIDSMNDDYDDFIEKQQLKQMLQRLNQNASSNTNIINKKQSLYNNAAYRIGWFVMLCLSILCLSCGIMSFIVKLAQFSFIHSSDILVWSISHWILVFGFSNQLWNMCNHEQIQIDAIFKFIFLDGRITYTSCISKKILLLDSIIKDQLCKTFTWKGFIISLGLNATILQAILLKDSFDLSLNDLIQYKKYKKQDASSLKVSLLHSINRSSISTTSSSIYKSTNSLDALKQEFKAKFSTLCNKCIFKSYQQPIHPYVAAKRYLIEKEEVAFSIQKRILNIYNDNNFDIASNINMNPRKLINYFGDIMIWYHYIELISTYFFSAIAAICLVLTPLLLTATFVVSSYIASSSTALQCYGMNYGFISTSMCILILIFSIATCVCYYYKEQIGITIVLCLISVLWIIFWVFASCSSTDGTIHVLLFLFHIDSYLLSLILLMCVVIWSFDCLIAVPYFISLVFVACSPVLSIIQFLGWIVMINVTKGCDKNNIIYYFAIFLCIMDMMNIIIVGVVSCLKRFYAHLRIIKIVTAIFKGIFVCIFYSQFYYQCKLNGLHGWCLVSITMATMEAILVLVFFSIRYLIKSVDNSFIY